ncbi:NAD(P)H-dependent oxidoreductase [Sporichthya brevicatena]|uniref:NAD(P)H-dependent oxidoreductase n=1 Tax=Sporichthya brevicatena TaxID=171442 RepID=A0ABP3RW26_9ACTN
MERIRLAVVVGSTREGRFGPTVAHWFAGFAARRPDVEVDVVDLLEPGVPGPRFSAAIDAADGVVVVTPEYNHSFPGPLKTAIDTLWPEWHAKPVAFVSYGGISGGLRAVEPLRGVFAELHAMTIRETVSFAGASAAFDADGNPKETDAVETAAERLLDQLLWWADALRTARATRPYAA